MADNLIALSVECNSCHRTVLVDSEGFLKSHPPRGTRCDGSGRHLDFVKQARQSTSDVQEIPPGTPLPATEDVKSALADAIASADNRAVRITEHVSGDPRALVLAAVDHFVGCWGRADRSGGDAFTAGRKEGYVQAIAFLTGLSHRETMDALRSGELGSPR